MPEAGYLGFDDEEGGDDRNFRLNLCLRGREEKGFYKINFELRVKEGRLGTSKLVSRPST